MKIYIDKYHRPIDKEAIYCKDSFEAIEFLYSYYRNIILNHIRYNIPLETYDEEIEVVDMGIVPDNGLFLEWCRTYEFYPPIHFHLSSAAPFDEAYLRSIMDENPHWVEIPF